MQLTLDRVRTVDLPLNISKYPNNSHLAVRQSAIYNDSVNLYQAIKLVIADSILPPSITDINVVHNSNGALIESSDGLDGVLIAVTDTLAGLMLPTDKIILDNLAVLVGITGSNLGTFTGSIISNNTTIKNALQQLETALETGLVGVTDLSTTYGVSDVTIVSSTGTDAVINAAGFLAAGVMSASDYALLTTLPSLQTAMGIPAGNADLGNFTGTVLTDNGTVKAALQELANAVASLSIGGGIYSGSGLIWPNATATTQGLGFKIDTNGTDNVYIGDVNGSGTGIVLAIEPTAITIGDVYNLSERILYTNSAESGIRFDDSHIKVNTNGLEMQADGIFTITGTGAFAGARYFADYSANYTLRSLVDKEYVDGITGVSTNISLDISNIDIDILSSSGTGATLTGATASYAGLMTAEDKNNLTDLIGLTGMPAGADHLGTFTGTTIPDSQSIKGALQSLETAVEAASLSAGGYQMVTTNWALESVFNTIYAKATANNINITCGASMKEGEVYYLYTRTDNSYTVNLMLGAGHQFFKTSLVSGVEFWTGSQSYSGNDRNLALMLQRRGTVIFLTLLTDF